GDWRSATCFPRIPDATPGSQVPPGLAVPGRERGVALDGDADPQLPGSEYPLYADSAAGALQLSADDRNGLRRLRDDAVLHLARAWRSAWSLEVQSSRRPALCHH